MNVRNSCYNYCLMDRNSTLTIWLAEKLSLAPDTIEQNLTLLAGDASFRRYYRLTLADKTYVVMDAPPDKEPVEPFVVIDKGLAQLGLSVPEIYHSDIEQGFLLLTDFGDEVYFQILKDNNADQLYTAALDELVTLQSCKAIADFEIPEFDSAMYTLELERFVFWFLERYLGLALTEEQLQMLETSFRFLIHSALEQPQVFVHRDYHSRNLVWTPEQQVGILDFQDAVTGAVTYDAVSLLRDCYIVWPKAKVLQWLLYYKQKVCDYNQWQEISDQQFIRWFDLMGIQRHLKAIYIFARKFCRDHQAEYLPDINHALNYVHDVIKDYPELKALQDFLRDIVQVRWEQVF